MVSSIVYFHPEIWGDDPIWRSYFWIGLKPPTRWDWIRTWWICTLCKIAVCITVILIFFVLEWKKPLRSYFGCLGVKVYFTGCLKMSVSSAVMARGHDGSFEPIGYEWGEMGPWGPYKSGEISSRPHRTKNPEKVANWKGIHLFQGNLGWWNMISFGQINGRKYLTGSRHWGENTLPMGAP